MSVYVFHSFFDWVVCFFDIELHELFVHFKDWSLVSCFICKYFLPFWGLSFILFVVSFAVQKLWSFAAAVAAKLLQSCPTLCDPIDGSPTGSPVPGILQAITLEWVAISSSNAWKWKLKVKSLSRVRLFLTPWTAAYQAPPSMGFSRQEYWSGVPSFC